MINATGARFCSNCSNALSNGLSSQTQYSNSSPNTLYGDTGNNPYPFTRETSNAPYTPINNPYAPTGNPYGQGTAPPPPPDDPSTATKPKPPYWTRRKLIIVGAGAAAATGLGAYLLTRPTPITLSFNYSTEKEDWMQGAIDDFNQSNTKIDGKPIQIQGTPLGSGDAVTQILDGKIKPAAWSPASDLELNQLINGWKKRHGDQDIIYSSKKYSDL